MDSQALAERHGARNYHPLPVTLVRAEGAYAWDSEGRRYLDMLSAYSAVNQGHRHPRIVAAAVEQLGKVALTSRAFHSEPLGPFLAKLSAVSGFSRVLPMNTGAEAVETAIKAARKWAYLVKGVPVDQAEIIVADGNFHGRTTTIVSFSTEEQYRMGFGPFTPGFASVPFGDAEALEQMVSPRTAAVLIEPIQGEGGVILPPPGYLARVREICSRHRVLLILDEIQTGLGRTGRTWACEHEGIRPDGLCVGKALGGGLYPVSAFCADDELMGVYAPGDHGSTFGGNPLAAAIGLAALQVMEDDDLPGRAAALGEHFMSRLRTLRSPVEVRGRGLLIGVELAEPARPACEALMARGLLCKDTHGTVVRFAPPLVVSKEALDDAFDTIAQVIP
ncbi:MAG: ornithine--oxo-acid transaminase [Deltaproteobacteria bacterium]|nr:ornithine--oxo-acid transaminase [Deltaproteobacteria bacterium]